MLLASFCWGFLILLALFGRGLLIFLVLFGREPLMLFDSYGRKFLTLFALYSRGLLTLLALFGRRLLLLLALFSRGLLVLFALFIGWLLLRLDEFFRFFGDSDGSAVTLSRRHLLYGTRSPGTCTRINLRDEPAAAEREMNEDRRRVEEGPETFHHGTR